MIINTTIEELPEEFNFCIARECSETGRISIYSYGSEVHFGKIEYAKNLLKYVREQTKNDDSFKYGYESYSDYGIYVLDKKLSI